MLRYRRGTILYKATGSKPFGVEYKILLQNNLVLVFKYHTVCVDLRIFPFDKMAAVSIIYEQSSYMCMNVSSVNRLVGSLSYLCNQIKPLHDKTKNGMCAQRRPRLTRVFAVRLVGS